MTRRGPKDSYFGSKYCAKLKVWKVYSQPWSAWPRAFHGRLVIFKFEVPLAVDVVVAIARFEVIFENWDALDRPDRNGL